MHSHSHPYPYRLMSNTVIGYLNLVTLLASIPIIGAGLWLAHGSAATCESALQAPLLAIGFIVLLVSLAGFIGACYHVTWALWLYLLAMLLLVVALLGITVFGMAVTADGGGRQVPALPGVPDKRLLGLAAEARPGRPLLAAGAGMRGWVRSVPQDRGLDAHSPAA